MTVRGSLSDITGVILVGGMSRRMGQDKIFLAIDDTPIISIIHKKLQSLFDKVLVIGHHRPQFDGLNIRSHSDIIPDRGALGGIYTGLALAETPYIFAVAGDMPFLDRDLMVMIASHREGNDAVIPRGSSGMEPLFAVYSQACTNPIRENLETGQLKILRAISDLRIAQPQVSPPADGSPDPLINLNTPEDLERLRR
jgi:molybdopterin-guanine dinucleotide biosynthesis protein A